MPSLSDKLKSLGIQVGARDIPPPAQTDNWPIPRVVPGRVFPTQVGETYLVENTYPSPFQTIISAAAIPPHASGLNSALEVIASWAGEDRILTSPLPAFAFLDIETTGLGVGAGTYAFLVGIARVDGDHLQLAQFFMRDPSEEPAHLQAIETWLANCEVLVTFNGKSFDAPLLASRYITQGWKNPLAGVAHLDLLHLARRLWRDRLPNRGLGNLEVDILGLSRTDEDVPGWMIPQMYFDYIHTGDARPLAKVFYHNAVDIASMASLLDHMTYLLEKPLQNEIEHPLDLLAISRLFEDLNRWDEAIQLYRLAIDRLEDENHRQDAIHRLSMIHKRRGEWEIALGLWRQAAEAQQFYACEELAKYYEHFARQPHEALHWTLTALDNLNAAACPTALRLEWQPQFQHRLERLKRKIT